MKISPYLGDWRTEIAWGTNPDDTNPAWTDVTDWLAADPGISIGNYGRGDEFSNSQTTMCTFTVDNTDGQFTPDNVRSQWYPNVEVLRRVRHSFRLVDINGNQIPANNFTDPSFNAGTIQDWVPTGSTAPALTLDATHTRSAGKAMLVTWGTNIFFPGPAATLTTVIGRVYTCAVYVYVPVGSTAVELIANLGGGNLQAGAASTSTGSFVRVSVTFTATAQSHVVTLCPTSATPSGQQCWVDDCQYDEGQLQAFSTVPMRFDPANPNLSSPVFDRYVGYINELPTEWPGGGQYSEAQISCVGRFSRLGDDAKFRSMLEEEYLADVPFAYYTLSEPAGSVMVGDTSENGSGSLAVAQLGAGGTITFAGGTGPGTDGLAAPLFVPVNSLNGQYLAGGLNVATNLFSRGHELELFFNTSILITQVIADATGPYGEVLRLSVDGAGRLQGYCPFGGAVLTSATVVSDGHTHHAALVESVSGTTVTCTLLLDGTSVATGTYPVPYGLLATINRLSIGGGQGTVFNGTIAHVALFDAALSSAQINSHAAVGLFGAATERSDQRIARLARYAGVPAADVVVETGLSTSIAAVNTSGSTPLQAMQDIENTESGVLFDSMSGKLTFHARSHRYNTSSVLTILADDTDPSTKFVRNRAYLVNSVTASRPNGITFTAVNAASKLRYGERSQSPTLLTTSDNEVVDAANWKANTNASLGSRLPALLIDLLTNPNIPATLAAVLAMDVSQRITYGSLPVTAPAGSMDFFLEGRSENFSESGWSIGWNTSPASNAGVWQLDSSTHSQLDQTTRLAY